MQRRWAITHYIYNDTVGVSILIQPEGRMQPTEPYELDDNEGYVSILIQPEGRMQQEKWRKGQAGYHRVSILIQPEGRMQLVRPLPLPGV